MDFKNWFLTEMPITNFQLKGNWDNSKKQYGFNRQDHGILTNPKAVEKIHKAWSNTKQNYSLYFIKSPVAYKFRQEGEVNPQWVQENLKLDIPAEPNAITVLFTNNVSGEKIPMTGWMIAHRFSHSIRRVHDFEKYFIPELIGDFRNILGTVYDKDLPRTSYSYSDESRRSNREREKLLKAISHAIGSMKSATTGNLALQEEFYHELLAQYMTTGKIKFRPLPTQLITQKRFAWGKPNHSYARGDEDQTQSYSEDYLPYMEEKYTTLFDQLLSGLVGKMFLM